MLVAPVVRFDSLRTSRLVMRRWRDSDREPFAALNADQHTMRFFPGTLDRAASDALVDRIEERFEAHGFGLWALEIARTGRFIGFTGLNPMPADVPGAGGMEVGWRLARPAWHHGYATEAARAALAVALSSLGMAEVYSMTALLNEPSLAVMRRLGLTEFVRWDHPRLPESSPLRPHVTYRLTGAPGLSGSDSARSGENERGSSGQQGLSWRPVPEHQGRPQAGQARRAMSAAVSRSSKDAPSRACCDIP
jgi:RimJ/RimL family protein N-acetyltransferase